MRQLLGLLARCVKWPFIWLLLGVHRRSRNWSAIQNFVFRQSRRWHENSFDTAAVSLLRSNRPGRIWR